MAERSRPRITRALSRLVVIAMSALALSAEYAPAQPGAESPAEDPLARGVLEVFKAHCAECHGPTLARPKGRFGYVLDLRRLVAEGQVKPGVPEDSDLFKLLVTQDPDYKMPPEESKGGPLTPGQIDTVRAWIAAGAKDGSPEGAGTRAGGAAGVGPGGASAEPAGQRRSGASRVLAFAGKFHPVVVHFPIALLMVGALAEAMALSGRAWAAQAARLCVPLGVASAVLATVLGLLSASFGGYATATIWTHRLVGILATVLAVGALALRPAYEDPSSHAATRRGLYRLGLLAAAALTGLAGHFGGVIVHGEDHFAF